MNEQWMEIFLIFYFNLLQCFYSIFKDLSVFYFIFLSVFYFYIINFV